MIIYKLHLIRHGMTQGNLDGKYIGLTDLPVCPEGMDELKTLIQNNEYPNVQKVYRSPLLRCAQTAQVIYPDCWTQVVEGLREYDFGAFEGKTIHQLKEDPAFLAWVTTGMCSAPPDGEQKPDFDARCRGALEQILADMMEHQITDAAVVAHGGIFMNLLSQFGMPKRDLMQWTIGNGRGYTVATSAQMWSRDHILEVFDSLPYHDDQTTVMRGYDIVDL